MIPKIIHYCWFGGKELPQSAIDCITSWKKYLPDFEIKCWNEETFDVNSHQFVKECYEAKKYGFIVDVLRNYVLINEGGIYLDTDVEFIKPLDYEMLNLSAFISYEINNFPNVGLVASEKNGRLVNDVFDLYNDRDFINEDGNFNQSFTGPMGYKKILEDRGLTLDGIYKNENNYVVIYPQEYFSPKSYETGLIELSKNTYAIHHYEATWIDDKELFYNNQRIGKILKYLKSALNESKNENELLNLLKKELKFSNSDLIIYALKDFYKNKTS